MTTFNVMAGIAGTFGLVLISAFLLALIVIFLDRSDFDDPDKQ